MVYVIEGYYQSDRHPDTRYWGPILMPYMGAGALRAKNIYAIFTDKKKAEMVCKTLDKRVANGESLWAVGMMGNDYPKKFRIHKQ